MEKVGVAASKIDDNFPLLGIYYSSTHSSSLQEFNLTNLHNFKPKITRGKSIYISFPFVVKSPEFYGVFFHELRIQVLGKVRQNVRFPW